MDTLLPDDVLDEASLSEDRTKNRLATEVVALRSYLDEALHFANPYSTPVGLARYGHLRGYPIVEVGSWGGMGIFAERIRQVRDEGWTPEHDDEHDDEELALAAVCYALPRGLPERSEGAPFLWPFEPGWWKPGGPGVDGRVRELEKAGALVAAEIDRLLRTKLSDEVARRAHATSARPVTAGGADFEREQDGRRAELDGRIEEGLDRLEGESTVGAGLYADLSEREARDRKELAVRSVCCDAPIVDVEETNGKACSECGASPYS